MNKVVDKEFLRLAKLYSNRSEDPNKRCGAFIVSPNLLRVSAGWNRFPTGVRQTLAVMEDKKKKLQRIIHAEQIAILLAKEPLNGCSLYQWPGKSCSHCAAVIIEAGIKKVVSPLNYEEDEYSSWKESHQVGLEMFMEAGVQCYSVDVYDEWWYNV